jgi:hypothetical protein
MSDYEADQRKLSICCTIMQLATGSDSTYPTQSWHATRVGKQSPFESRCSCPSCRSGELWPSRLVVPRATIIVVSLAPYFRFAPNP